MGFFLHLQFNVVSQKNTHKKRRGKVKWIAISELEMCIKRNPDETADEYDIQRLSRLYVVNAISMHLWINGVEKRKL